MVHQESNFIYRPAVKSEVLVSRLSPLQGICRGANQGPLEGGECVTGQIRRIPILCLTTEPGALSKTGQC